MILPILFILAVLKNNHVSAESEPQGQQPIEKSAFSGGEKL